MKNYQEEYKKGRTLAEDIVRAISDNDDEQQPMLHEYTDEESSRQLLEKICDKEYLKEGLKGYATVIPEDAVYLLTERIKKRDSKNHIRRWIYATSGIAATIALLILFFSRDDRSIIKPLEDIYTTNVTIPTIVLNTGERIALKRETEDLQQIQPINYLDSTTLIYRQSTDKDVAEQLNVLLVPSRYTYKLVLEDGTEVLLNANSELTYPTTFGSDKREVRLKGEAYFTVAKSDIPFIVISEQMQLRVYGTQFNLNTRRSENMEALLVDGIVGIMPHQQKEVMMEAGDLFTYNKHNGNSLLRKTNTENILGWKSGYFVCEQEPLHRLLDDISAWYGVKFIYPNNDCVGDKKITLRIDRQMELDKLLESLQVAFEIQFIKEGSNEYMVE